MESPARTLPTGDGGFESTPLTRNEYVTVLTHFYRGEVGRSTAWRSRLDATTNWAILTCAAVLSFAFGSESHPHVVLLLSHLILCAYLMIEARRYRYFEVYRARVRMLEENFLIPVVTRELASPMRGWRDLVAMDLDLPKFKSDLAAAIGFRLRSNYLWMFAAMTGGWFAKVSLHPTTIVSSSDFWSRMAIGVGPR